MTLLTRRPLRHGNMTAAEAAAESVGWKWRHQRGESTHTPAWIDKLPRAYSGLLEHKVSGIYDKGFRFLHR
ncbi:hypothetical protein E2C01_082772 [Portunus trituberculatus]|uniref:Uncharacterized protein n=1 Tax=Portunus trituberculatus TaxID=210409 RepID=A0A5B7IVF8_PORTR|nr:hypothetical protein [Portunus trituberculatus]